MLGDYRPMGDARYRTTTDEERQRIAEEDRAIGRRMLADCQDDNMHDAGLPLDLGGDDSPIAPQPSAKERLLSALRAAANAAGDLGMVTLRLRLAEIRAKVILAS